MQKRQRTQKQNTNFQTVSDAKKYTSKKRRDKNNENFVISVSFDRRKGGDQRTRKKRTLLA